MFKQDITGLLSGITLNTDNDPENKYELNFKLTFQDGQYIQKLVTYTYTKIEEKNETAKNISQLSNQPVTENEKN
jgi:hypothetical protein